MNVGKMKNFNFILFCLNYIAGDLSRNNPIPAYRGIFDAISKMYLNEGFSSLYRGVVMNAFAGSIANSIFFYVYQDGK